MRALRIALTVGVLVQALAAQGAVRVERITYHKWPRAYRLSNGTVDLVVVPQIGRIMRYGPVGGPNMLWENRDLWGKTVDVATAKEWTNFGGDKLWPAPQAVWKWPPDPTLDAAALTVKVQRGGRLLLLGQMSPKAHLRFEREISLAPSGTTVTLRNTMVNAGRKPVRWAVWEITQTDNPKYAELPLNRRGHFPRGYYVFKDNKPSAGCLTVGRGVVRLKRHPKIPGKIGADSPAGWAAARVGDHRFTVRTSYQTGKAYPDDGCGQEVWSNTDPLKYMELELLGPMRTLRPGGQTTLVTRWSVR